MKKSGRILLLFLLPLVMLSSCKKDPMLLVSDFITYMDEHPAPGKVIGTISAGSSEGSLTFSIKESVPENVLGIDAATGVLTVADAPQFDYEVNELIEAEVKVVCDGVSRTVNVKIYLNDIELIAGNNTTTGFSELGNMGANYLLGRKYRLTGSGTLLSLNFIGRATGANVMMALYDDNNGAPGDRVAYTASGVVNSWGVISLPVSPVELEAGDYWIMAVYSATGNHTFKTAGNTGTIFYTSLAFGTTPPATASTGFTSYNGADFTYFMVVD